MSLVRISWKNSRLTLAIFAVITLLLAANLHKLKVMFSAEDLAGQGFASADELKSIKGRYQDGVNSIFILSPPPGKFTFTTEELCKIRKWYSYKRNALPELLSSLSTFDFKQIKREMQSSGNNKMVVRNLLDLDCRNNILISDPHKIRDSLNTSPFAMAIEKKEQMTILFQFVFKDSTTSKLGSFDPLLFDQLRDSAHKDLMPLIPGASIHWIGPGDYQWYIFQGFKFSKYVNLAMILFMFVALRVFFGTWKAGCIFCGTLIIATIWVFGLKGVVGSGFDVLSTGLVLLLAISSLEDFTFTCYDQIESKDWRKSVLKLALPSFYTSLTTIVGFLALRSSEVEAIQRMGIWAAWGSLVQWILLFIFIPALMQQFPGLRLWGNPKKAMGISFFSHSIFKSMPKKVSLLSLLVFPLALYFYPHISYNETPHHIFPKEQEYSKSMDYLMESKGWLGSTSLLFEPNTPPEKMKSIVDQIVAAPEVKDLVTKHESPWEIQSWLKMNGNLDDLESSSYFNLSKVSEQFTDENKKTRAIFYIKETAVYSVSKLKEVSAKFCDKYCHLGGEMVAYSDFASLVPKSLVDSLFSSIIQVSLVICFVAYAQRKEKYILSLLLAAFWGPFFVIMLLGAFNSTLDFWKSIFASILIGLAGDNALQFLFGSENKHINDGMKDRGAASIITALLMAMGALMYLGSYFNSPREFGVILSFGLLASLFGELWLFQGLIDIDFFTVLKFKKKK